MKSVLVGLWVGLARLLWCTGPTFEQIVRAADERHYRPTVWLFINGCGCAWCRRQPVYGSPPPRDA